MLRGSFLRCTFVDNITAQNRIQSRLVGMPELPWDVRRALPSAHHTLGGTLSHSEASIRQRFRTGVRRGLVFTIAILNFDFRMIKVTPRSTVTPNNAPQLTCRMPSSKTSTVGARFR